MDSRTGPRVVGEVASFGTDYHANQSALFSWPFGAPFLARCLGEKWGVLKSSYSARGISAGSL